MSDQTLPPGWDEERVKRVLDYYESQSDEDAAAEHDAAFEAGRQTLVDVPAELLDEVRALIAKRRAG